MVSLCVAILLLSDQHNKESVPGDIVLDSFPGVWVCMETTADIRSLLRLLSNYFFGVRISQLNPEITNRTRLANQLDPEILSPWLLNTARLLGLLRMSMGSGLLNSSPHASCLPGMLVSFFVVT